MALAATLRTPARERDRAERRQRAEQRERLIRRLRVEQRPRFARFPGADARDLAARNATVAAMEATVLRDARRRARLGQLEGPFQRAECEPFPRTVGGTTPERDLARSSGRYSCVAVSAEFKATEDNVGGVLGQQYRTRVDFRTGRYASCKIAGQAGPTRDPLATTPRACGGGP